MLTEISLNIRTGGVEVKSTKKGDTAHYNSSTVIP